MARQKLRVVIRLSGDEAALWRAPLARLLRAEGHEACFARGPVDPAPPGARLLAQLEALIYRRARPETPEKPERQPPSGAIDFYVGGGVEGADVADAPTLALTCEGQPFAVGAAAALLDGRSPHLEARLEGRILAVSRAAVEEPHLYAASLSQVAGRMAQTAMAALRRLEVEGFEASSLPEAQAARGAPTPLSFAWRTLAGKLAARLSRLARREDRWRVAWRPAAAASVESWSGAAFVDVADDGRRYYADPFAFHHQGRTFVLCEEFPFETGRAILSVFEIAEGRARGVPRPILERPYHLSYPMVFALEGSIWMIPETSAANRIELYRALQFPDHWERVAILVEGVRASDATLLMSGERLWLFAAVADADGSSWDRLCLWSAPRLTGDWRPHPGNPVLIDASCARPAGPLIHRAGLWLRPAQDCSRIYGGGLAWCAIDRLDDAGFSQRPIARLGPPPGSGALGTHTLSAAGGYEAIDLFGPRPRGRNSLNFANEARQAPRLI